MTSFPRIAVFLSGSGRTLQNFQDRISDHTMPGTLVDVVSSNAGAYGLERARKAGLAHTVIDPRDHAGRDAFADAVYDRLSEKEIDLVLLAGYMVFFPTRPEWTSRVMNIHPALLPAFGGKGYHGMKVHRAVLEAGVTESGCTVHFVDDEYDHGPIIVQRRVPVRPGDTPEELAARVFTEELEAYPEAVRLFSEDRLRIVGDRVEITRMGKSRADRADQGQA